MNHLRIGNRVAKWPIIHGGMGIGISLSSLAGALAKEGGIGIISGVQIGYREEDFQKNNLEANKRAMRVEIRKAREIAPEGIIGVNLLAAMTAYDELIRTAIEEKYEVKIPVVFAGAIFDGKDIAQYLQLDASEVQMGTRFVATEECNADLDFRMSYVHARAEDIRLVKSPVGMPGRAIENDFTRKLDEGNIPVKRCYNCLIPCDPRTTPYCISDALIHSAEGTEGLIFAEANAFRDNEIISIKEHMRKLIEETREHLDP